MTNKTHQVHLSSVLVGLVMSLCILACGSDSTGPALRSGAETYWALRLNYHAANLALSGTGTTIQLVATPLTGNGDTISDAGPVTYTTTDSTVRVDSTGLVTALYQTKNVNSPTSVVATLQYHNLTLADTAFIQVVSASPASPLATFVLKSGSQSGTPSCNLNSHYVAAAIENCGPLTVDATDATGDTLLSTSQKSLVVAYSVSDLHTAQVDRTGKITETDTGHVTFYASTWAYGISMRDSIDYVVGWPRYLENDINQTTPISSLTPVLGFALPALTLAVGGTVMWMNKYATPIDIVFDNPTNVEASCYLLTYCFLPSTGSGNIPPFYSDTTYTDTSAFAFGIVVRSFPVAGTYRYHSSLYPTSSGVIYVKEGLQ